MWKHLKELTLRKKNGDSNFIAGLIVVTTLLITFLTCTLLLYDISNANDIKSVCRGYLYTMEIHGYLTDGNQQALIDDLEALGAKNISLDGTTTEELSYGNVVTLQVSMDIPYTIANLSEYSAETGYISTTLVRHTVSKN